MATFFGLLFILLMVFLIVGLFQPMILKKHKPQPTRKDVLKVFGIPALVVLIIIAVIAPPIDYFKKGNESYMAGNYEDAYRQFCKVKKGDKNYTKALATANDVKSKIDSLNNLKNLLAQQDLLNQGDKKDQKKSKAEVAVNPDENKTNIPGIQPADVYLSFEKKGFTTEKKIDSEGAIYNSDLKEDGITYQVVTYCEGNVSTVKSLRLIATRMTPQSNNVEDMKPFLKFGCSIPYDGSDSKKVSAFIDKNYFVDKASIIISSVKFTIYVPTEFMRMIDIEKVR